MTSTGPPGLMLTVAAAFGRQPDATSLRAALHREFEFLLAGCGVDACQAGENGCGDDGGANRTRYFHMSPFELKSSGRHVHRQSLKIEASRRRKYFSRGEGVRNGHYVETGQGPAAERR